MEEGKRCEKVAVFLRRTGIALTVHGSSPRSGNNAVASHPSADPRRFTWKNVTRIPLPGFGGEGGGVVIYVKKESEGKRWLRSHLFPWQPTTMLISWVAAGAWPTLVPIWAKHKQLCVYCLATKFPVKLTQSN